VKKVVTLKINGAENKDKVIQSLANSGYIVGAELKQDSLYRPIGWEVEVYVKGECINGIDKDRKANITPTSD
jgi:hypothetical protein